jgi:DNA-binding transcriptional LysR family regulator
VRLFDRSKRHVAPTVEGAAFEAAAERVLAEFDTAIAGVHDRAALRRGRVSLALLPSLAAGWLPDMLARFRTRFPGITVDVADVLSEPCIERVMTMRADFALAAVRAETPELQAEVFCADDFHLVCRADHPLARAPALRVRDLAAWPFIHLSRTSSVRQYLDAAFHPQAMDTVMEVDQLATVMGMVRAGLGISVVPALALFHFQQPEIATRPVHLPGLARRIYLVRRRDRSLSIAAQALHDLVLAHRPAPAPAKATPRRRAKA